MTTATKSYPYASFRFRVEIGGITEAQFSDVSGLSLETEVEQYQEGSVNDFVHQLPTRTKYPHIILKHGITDKDELWKWYQDVVRGDFKRKSGAIILMDLSGEDKLRWEFIKAYPVKWSGPDLKSESSTVAFETIELVHHGLRKA